MRPPGVVVWSGSDPLLPDRPSGAHALAQWTPITGVTCPARRVARRCLADRLRQRRHRARVAKELDLAHLGRRP